MSSALGLAIPIAGLGLPELEALVRQADEVGYADLWVTETNRLDAFAVALLAAVWTSSARIGTGVAGALTRGSALLAQQAAAVQEMADGRFVLGLGVSSEEIVEGWNRCSYERPLASLEERLGDVRKALAGEVTDGGFSFERPPADPPPIFLGAQGPRALRLAVREAAGLVLNLAPRSRIPDLIDSLGPLPDGFEVVCHVGCFPGPREEQDLPARWSLATYLAVPAYGRFLARLGYEREVGAVAAAWRQGRQEEAMAAIPAELLEDVYGFGEIEEIRATLAAYPRLGITVPIVQLVSSPGRYPELVRDLLDG